MGILSRARDALLGISAYQPPEPLYAAELSLDSPEVERIRKTWGGNIAMPAQTRSRWYLADVETAEHLADNGRLTLLAQMMSWARRDGILAGVLSTRTDGLVRLPKHFRGDPDVIAALEIGHEDTADVSAQASVRSVFDEMFPASELALLAADGLLCGVGVGELVPVKGRDFPVFQRMDPQFLEYLWVENRWYYRGTAGRLPVTPGDGHWILHIPGGRISPWQCALWRCLGQATIRKNEAALQKQAWENKLAQPARVATSPQGASEAQSQAWFKAVMAWGINTVFGLRPGYDVKLLESNGRGWESYNRTIELQNNEIIISIAGQTVTVEGGAGFQNSDIHKTIRSDLIQSTGDTLAHTINTQGIPVFVALRFGEEAVVTKPCVMEWDVTPPKDRNAEASSLVTAAQAITGLAEALAPHGMALDVPQMCLRFAIPLLKPEAVELDANGRPKLRVIEGGAGAGAVETDTTITPIDSTLGDQQAEDTALNGAQVASLLQVVQGVADGLIPRDAAIGIIKRAFLVDDAGAEEMLGSAGKGFVPKPPPTAAPAPAPAPDAPAPAAETEAA